MPRPNEEEDSVDVVRHDDECIKVDAKVSGDLEPAGKDSESRGR